jgi:hypothetical protein
MRLHEFSRSGNKERRIQALKGLADNAKNRAEDLQNQVHAAKSGLKREQNRDFEKGDDQVLRLRPLKNIKPV